MRKFLLTSGVTLIVVGAVMYALGLYENTKPTGGGANIGAGILAVLGEALGIIGLCAVVASAVTALIVWLRKRSSARG
ncbi:hypothetical protein [Brevibacterium spongiae]|uniref:Uncharacterized protein n=1 Tax=Brevibacterium spongiae TaxID=2909672 RepID=A0ABY5SNG3_9MICO|nr:hypothetical protein [Brevibacterium spongiae]UVI34711.1 hypothetical protein L1F31_11275 [Brevibacterium spongiae]